MTTEGNAQWGDGGGWRSAAMTDSARAPSGPVERATGEAPICRTSDGWESPEITSDWVQGHPRNPRIFGDYLGKTQTDERQGGPGYPRLGIGSDKDESDTDTKNNRQTINKPQTNYRQTIDKLQANYRQTRDKLQTNYRQTIGTSLRMQVFTKITQLHS